MINLGVDDAVAWDGSNSATLTIDNKVKTSPANYKNYTTPFGVGFRIKK
ncbi:MAG: hypothetical protein IPJ13_24010 [Saprospiraceae bacterium]|nr:hypothetical protein [Saprospiraceae bacterium]